MPVSHLGLTVSHVPAATSFYLQALQPLGYHYIGQSGDSVGLGVHEADLFLTQEPSGSSVSPTHIAFLAGSRATVRDCYAAALSAGGYPSGAPSYRNGECTVFNAAAEDLDGNVIEFLYRERSAQEEGDDQTIAPSENSRVITWQKDVAGSALQDDAQSLSSRISRTKSRGRTAMDLVSSTSRSIRSMSEAPASSVSRARAIPMASTGDFPTQAFFGTILGAAAGAAIAFAMTKAEKENSKNEAAFFVSTRSRSAGRAKPVACETIMEPPESKAYGNISVAKSRATGAAKNHRNYSVTESAYSRRYPPRSIMRTIEPAGYANEDDEVDDEVREAISRYTASRRPLAPQRSRTIDAIEYAPVSHVDRSSRSSTAKRSATLPLETPKYYLEAPPKPKSTASHHSTRHSKHGDEMDLARRDSGVSMGSHRSQHGPADGSSHKGRRSSTTVVTPSRQYESAVDVHLPTSKAPSHISRHSVGTARSSRQDHTHHESAAEVPLPASKAPSHTSHRSASTVRPSRREHSRYESAVEVPLPTSKAPSHASATSASTVRPSRREHMHHDSAAGVPLPASQAPSRVSAAKVPIPESNGGGWDPEDSDGMGDTRTVVPDDSISCVGFAPKAKSSKGEGHNGSSRHSSRRSEAAEGSEHTVRPSKKKEGSRHSAATLPARSKEEYYGSEKRGKRSVLSYA
ncbi:hypothetical protein LTR08_008548 [Meristemomyces frigidus]|nr:hypothetical protein LTR08_008548 [Meristemomyces frigidus]